MHYVQKHRGHWFRTWGGRVHVHFVGSCWLLLIRMDDFTLNYINSNATMKTEILFQFRSKTACTTLLRTTLSAIPIYMSITTCMSKWAIDQIDKQRQAFLWSCTDSSVATGGDSPHMLRVWPSPLLGSEWLSRTDSLAHGFNCLFAFFSCADCFFMCFVFSSNKKPGKQESNHFFVCSSKHRLVGLDG